VFRTNPSNVNLLIELVNDYHSMDNYVFPQLRHLNTAGADRHVNWQVDETLQLMAVSAAPTELQT